jgi:hypothetical protein
VHLVIYFTNLKSTINNIKLKIYLQLLQDRPMNKQWIGKWTLTWRTHSCLDCSKMTQNEENKVIKSKIWVNV